MRKKSVKLKAEEAKLILQEAVLEALAVQKIVKKYPDVFQNFKVTPFKPITSFKLITPLKPTYLSKS